MKQFLVALLVFSLLLGGAAGKGLSSSGNSSGSDSSTSSTDSGNRDTGAIDSQEEIDFSGEASDDNIFSKEEVVKFADKGLVNWTQYASDLPQGKTYKVLSKNGWTDENNGELKEKGWSQIINDFVGSSNFFEQDTDRVAYLSENDDFAAGKANDFPIHRKQLLRLLAYAASSDGVSLSDQARIPVPFGSLYWTNAGQWYLIPTFLGLSYKSSEDGVYITPAMDHIGFEMDGVVEAPYEMDWSSDVFAWYFQEHVD